LLVPIDTSIEVPIVRRRLGAHTSIVLSKEENELLTRVEDEAPMGQAMRRYWLPALLAEDVAKPGGRPVRVRLFGEDLVAFRDSEGKLGLIEEHCPHRLASFAIGRNEDCGIVCIYHGWKFDVNGKCMDMPTEPEDHGFKDRVRIQAYPVREANGLVWTYMGPPAQEPPFPAFHFTTMPREQIGLVKVGIRANFLQTIEGAIDSAHSWFLHRGSSRDWNLRIAVSTDTSPRLEADDTPYGFHYAATRKPVIDPDTTKYVRITKFVMPCFAFIAPPLDKTKPVHTQIFVPVDNETSMLFDVYFSQNDSPVSSEEMRTSLHARRGIDLDENDFRFAQKSNNWLQDRDAMDSGSWTGIEGFQNQDIAAQESMGRISNRTREHLGMSDVAVIRMRKRMLENVRRFQAGETLIGLGGDVAYPQIASAQCVMPIDQSWKDIGAVVSGEH
jgi:phthalate 4,5-dioxygenase